MNANGYELPKKTSAAKAGVLVTFYRRPEGLLHPVMVHIYAENA